MIRAGGAGLVDIGPLVVFTTYGIVTRTTGGRLTLAYAVTPVVMAFTALSYARMAAAFPVAAAVLCLSFVGSDAVSTLSEEATRPTRDVPRATMTATLGCGLLFIVLAGRLSLRFGTPARAVLLVGAVSLLAVVINLDTMASIVSDNGTPGRRGCRVS